jgi:hypothetical protein
VPPLQPPRSSYASTWRAARSSLKRRSAPAKLARASSSGQITSLLEPTAQIAESLHATFADFDVTLAGRMTGVEAAPPALRGRGEPRVHAMVEGSGRGDELCAFAATDPSLPSQGAISDRFRELDSASRPSR